MLALTPVSLVSSAGMLILIGIAIYKALAYHDYKKAQRDAEHESDNLISGQIKMDKNPAWMSCLKRPKPKSLPAELYWTYATQRLTEDIEAHYFDLLHSSKNIRDNAPILGLFFTVVGIMLALTQVGDRAQMLTSVGIALSTTACSSFIVVIVNAIISGIEGLMHQDFVVGIDLLEKALNTPTTKKGG